MIQVTHLILKINGKEEKLTLEEAKALYDELHKWFGTIPIIYPTYPTLPSYPIVTYHPLTGDPLPEQPTITCSDDFEFPKNMRMAINGCLCEGTIS